MQLSKELIEHLASLARLELTDEEKNKYLKDFSSILGYVEKIQKMTAPEVSLIDETHVNVWRKDEVQECTPDERKAIIDSFPEKEGELLKVKAVFE